MKKIEIINKVDDEVISKSKFNIFTLKELNENAKNEAIKCFEEDCSNSNSDFLQEYIEEDLYYKDHIKVDHVWYSLCYCQGDGLCFEAKEIIRSDMLNSKDEEKINPFEKYLIENLTADQLNNLIYDIDNYNLQFSIKHNNSRYYHKYTCYVDYSDNSCYLNEDLKTSEDLLDSIIKHIEEIFYKLCDWYEDYGYKMIYPSNDDILEYIENLDEIPYFTDDGSFYGYY